MSNDLSKRSASIRRVLLITFVCNLCVSGAKIAYGYFSHSVSIAADGFHSMFDGISNIVGFIGVYVASHPPDEDHPYGHRKYETIFTIFIGVMMFLTCFEIFKQVYGSFRSGRPAEITGASFLIMLLTMAVNIFVAVYEKRMGQRLQSEFLIADAMHTKSDIYATAGVITGLIFIKFGFRSADAIVGAIVGVLVARAGIGILRESADILADRRPTGTTEIKDIVCKIDNVIDCHRIRTRGTNSHIFVDLHVVVRPDISMEAGHEIAHIAEERIKSTVAGVVDVVVHVEPHGCETENED